jgi:hypothetical protein
MAVPWMRILDTVLGISDIARSRKPRSPAAVLDDPQQQLEAGTRALGGLEARLAGVVVAALKEAFDRDSHRLNLEREQLAAERERAERAMRLELRRQAADREIGRLRLLSGIAVASWIGTLFFSARLIGGPTGARVALGAGWLLLLLAFASAFTGQSRVAEAATRAEDGPVDSGLGGALAVWMIVLGLGLIALAVLV